MKKEQKSVEEILSKTCRVDFDFEGRNENKKRVDFIFLSLFFSVFRIFSKLKMKKN